LAVYTQAREIFIASAGGQDMSKVYAFPENMRLENWLWLPGSEDLLFVTSDEDGHTALFDLSVADRAVTSVNLPIIAVYDIVSLSYRSLSPSLR
jgi:hypothetical protein